MKPLQGALQKKEDSSELRLEDFNIYMLGGGTFTKIPNEQYSTVSWKPRVETVFTRKCSVMLSKG